MKKNLNKEQYGFLVTENVLYIIIIGYLLSFMFSGKYIINLIKRLFTKTPTQPTKLTTSGIISNIVGLIIGVVLSLVRQDYHH